MTKELEQRVADQARQLKAAVRALEKEKIERERVEEKLREIGARSHLSADVAGLGGWRLDLTTGALETSDRCKVNFGLAPDEEMSFERLFELIHSDDRDRVRDALKKAADPGIEYDVEYRMIWPDGGVHWILAHGRTFFAANGTPLKIVGVTQNITERKRAAERLRESEERFRRYFELGLIGLAITSPTKGCLEVNDRICEILGYERGELLRMTWAQMTHPDDLAADGAQFNRVLAGEIDSYSMDKRWIRKDGRVIHSTISVYCLRRADGSVDHFVAMLQDVTQRKRAEEALRRTHEALEQRVVERTSQLVAVNTQLRGEIAERKRVEENLRHAIQRVEMILGSITDRFIALDSEWRYTRFNKHAEEQLWALGKNPASLIGKVLWKEFPSFPHAEAFRRAMCERAVITHEFYSPLLGEWVENRIYPSSDGGLAVFQRYITERKRADEEQRRLASLVENSTDFIGFASLEGQALIVNPAGQKMLGIDGDAQVRTTWISDYVVEQDRERLLEQAVPKVMREAQWEGEMRFRHFKTGAAIPMLQHIFLVKERGSNKSVALATIARDITERKRAEEELRRSETYLAEGQRLSHIGSWAWKISTGTLFWSEEQFRVFGFNPEPVAPSYATVIELLHPDDRTFVLQAFDQTVREQRDGKWDCRIVTLDGAIKHVHTTAHPVFNESGELTEYVGTTMDITERKRAEEALRRTQAELAPVTRVLSLGELTTSIAHEVNQPLAAIVINGHACLRWLEGEPPNLPAAKETVNRIIRDGNRAADVIKRIRALLRKTNTKKARLDINAIIHEVVSLTHGEALKNRVSLETDLAPVVPMVMGARVELQQVILNLVINGIEAMTKVPKRKRKLVIKSQPHTLDEDSGVLVAVQDAGIGITEQNIDRLFEGFYTTKPLGLGMGLQISRTIVGAHGGRLWAAANVGIGATFQFFLPSASPP